MGGAEAPRLPLQACQSTHCYVEGGRGFINELSLREKTSRVETEIFAVKERPIRM